MVDATKVNINMIKSMDSEHSFGPMEENTLETGKRESNMEEESTTFQVDKKKLENGFRVKK